MSERTIFETLSGSHVYGTNVATSDKDYKGIVIPDKKNILLQTVARTRNNASNKAEGVRNGPQDCDREYFALHYYMHLLMDGQTHPVEMLFIPSTFWTVTSPEWEEIVAFRHLLLSKKLTAFVGYAKNQANKYSAKGERYATVKAFVDFLKPCGKNLPLSAYLDELKAMVLSYSKHSKIVLIPNGEKLVAHLEVCGRKIDLQATCEYALNCYEWVYKEYGDRAKASVEGTDWKAVMHAIRIAEEALEILQFSSISFPRPNVDLLLDIRNGKVKYDMVMDHFELLLEQINAASALSRLQDEPNTALAEHLTLTAYTNAVMEGFV